MSGGPIFPVIVDLPPTRIAGPIFIFQLDANPTRGAGPILDFTLDADPGRGGSIFDFFLNGGVIVVKGELIIGSTVFATKSTGSTVNGEF